MVDVTYKKFGLSINAVWFCNNAKEAYDESNADIVYFHGLPSNDLHKGICSSQHTLLTDLRRPENEIFDEFGQNCRRKIKKAEKEKHRMRDLRIGRGEKRHRFA